MWNSIASVHDHCRLIYFNVCILRYSRNDTKIIPTYAYFAQFDWLVKRLYTSINSMSRNLGTIVPPPAQKICNNVDKNISFMTKLEL